MTPTVIMRSNNDMPIIAETLDLLFQQKMDFSLIVFDNASTDGTIEEVRKYTDRIVQIPAGQYIPGKVLNQGMRQAESEFVVFLNSDCPPQHGDWLERLLAGFDSDDVAAVFGQQMPRLDCKLLYIKDTEATFGDGRNQKYWRHCFSMASSAIRKSLWDKMPFDKALQFSEDIDWTWRARQKGYLICYIPDAIVMHSHNYTLTQLYKRQYGEGKAEADIFEWPAWHRNILRYSILPYVRQVLSDWRYCLKRGALGTMVFSPVLRLSHLLGRRKGFNEGWKNRLNQKGDRMINQ
jgi:rhamnosyltransferase